MTLLDRRRALMEQKDGAPLGVMFEWRPSDGLSPLSISASSGETNYTLLDSALRVYVLSSWRGQMVNPATQIQWGNRYKITVEGSFYGGATNLIITSRLDEARNNRLRYNNAQTLYVEGAQNNSHALQLASSQPVTFEFIVDKSAGKIMGTVNGTTYGPYDISDSTSTYPYFIYVEGGGASFYWDITHIKIENL